jgi:hypothetical protein
MKKIFKYIVASFDTTTSGASARKLTAFWFIVLASYVHYQHLHESNSVEFLLIDAVTALLLLSVITVQDLINLRAGNTTVSKQEITIKDTKTEATPEK